MLRRQAWRGAQEQDWASLFDLLHLDLAADQGHATAQYCIGTCYAGGHGLKQDLGEAARIMWRGAVNQGNADTQRVLHACSVPHPEPGVQCAAELDEVACLLRAVQQASATQVRGFFSELAS